MKISIPFLFFFLFILSEHTFAQSGKKAKVDSLEKILAASKDDTNKVILLNTLAPEYKIKDPDKAIKTAEQALALAQKLDYPSGEAWAYVQLGNGYKSKSEFDR